MRLATVTIYDSTSLFPYIKVFGDDITSQDGVPVFSTSEGMFTNIPWQDDHPSKAFLPLIGSSCNSVSAVLLRFSPACRDDMFLDGGDVC